MCRRPSFTWLITNQETGATLEYQGQRVWFEWQSLQAAVRIRSTAGGTLTLASSVSPWITGGFVRTSLMNFIATIKAQSPNMAPRKYFFISFSNQVSTSFLIPWLWQRPFIIGYANNARSAFLP